MKSILKATPAILASIIAVVGITYAAGSLTAPSGTPSATSYTLGDIFNKLSDFTYSATEGDHDVSTTTDPSTSFASLTEIYELLTDEDADLVSSKIASTTSIFGVTGTLYGDTDPSKVLTTATYPGTATAGPATLTWQDDPALTLCWSYNQFEIDGGCTVGSGFIQTPDTLTTLGAVEYCEYLNTNGTTLANTEQNIWHLPTITEYQSITDFSIYNNATQVPGFAGSSNYWSGTVVAEDAGSAWVWYTYDGDVSGNGKYGQSQVRCAH